MPGDRVKVHPGPLHNEHYLQSLGRSVRETANYTASPKRPACNKDDCEVNHSPQRDQDHSQNLHTQKPPLPI